MRERIEKKLGCTIEECVTRIKMLVSGEYEAEFPNPFLLLTEEEADYLESFQ